ncbi:MAG: hypothetical protein LBM13_02035, partial [Candidatus Ancillula sp.]|nr:hypothetical protein [Candidatus Ancillula sp.]
MIKGERTSKVIVAVANFAMIVSLALVALVLPQHTFFASAASLSPVQAPSTKAAGSDSSLAFQVTGSKGNSGDIAGGNVVTLTGSGMPHASTDDYLQDTDNDQVSDLVSQFDGINNTGKGDTAFDSSANYWQDLKDPSNFVKGVNQGTNTDGSKASWWNPGGGIFLNSPTTQEGNNLIFTTVPKKFKTYELVTRINVKPTTANSDQRAWPLNFTSQLTPVNADGTVNSSGTINTPCAASGAGEDNNCGTLRIGSGSNSASDTQFLFQMPNYNTSLSTNSFTSVKDYYDLPVGQLVSLAVSYNPDDKTVHAYINGTEIGSCSINLNGSNDTCQSTSANATDIFSDINAIYTYFGHRMNRFYSINGTDMAFRQYDTFLDASQVASNFAIDKKRFFAPPQICLVPAGTASGSIASTCTGSNLATGVIVKSSGEMAFSAPAQTQSGLYQIYAQYGESDSNFYDTGQSYLYTSGSSLTTCGYTISDTTNTSCGANNVLSFTNGGTYTIFDDSNSSIGTNHSIKIPSGQTVTLNVINNLSGKPTVSGYSGIDDLGTLTLNISDGVKVDVDSPLPKAGVHVPSGASLTIQGSGDLLAVAEGGGVGGAGIGGNTGASSGVAGETAGTVNILGGVNVSAKSNANYAAGIGGAASLGTDSRASSAGVGDGANLTINTTGTVRATSGEASWDSSKCGAGIGGANYLGANGLSSGSGGTVNIQNGTVIALAGGYETKGDSVGGSAGLGSGLSRTSTADASLSTEIGNPGVINISGGKVIAKGGVARNTSKSSGTGIGYGGQGANYASTGAAIFETGGSITISGGEVIAASDLGAVSSQAGSTQPIVLLSYGIGMTVTYDMLGADGKTITPTIDSTTLPIVITGGNVYAYGQKYQGYANTFNINSIYPTPVDGSGNYVYPSYIPTAISMTLTNSIPTDGTNFTVSLTSGSASTYKAQADDVIANGTFSYLDALAGDDSPLTFDFAKPGVMSGVMSGGKSGGINGMIYLPATASSQSVNGDGNFATYQNLLTINEVLGRYNYADITYPNNWITRILGTQTGFTSNCGYQYKDLGSLAVSCSNKILTVSAGTAQIMDDGSGTTDHSIKIPAGSSVTLDVVGPLTANPTTNAVSGIDVLGSLTLDTGSAPNIGRVQSNSPFPNAGIHVPATSSLIMQGAGYVLAYAATTTDAYFGSYLTHSGGAGIGGSGSTNPSESAGTIQILGDVDVSAYADGNGAAGIGGGVSSTDGVSAGDGGVVTINTTGTVTAVSGQIAYDSTVCGAGIGGAAYVNNLNTPAYSGSGGTVNIINGTVNAVAGGTATPTNSGGGSAGIGSGNARATSSYAYVGNPGTINISGGTIFAQGGQSGNNAKYAPAGIGTGGVQAGLGGATYETGGSINISGGTIIAISSTQDHTIVGDTPSLLSYGIGQSYPGVDGYAPAVAPNFTINITGGNIYAYGQDPTSTSTKNTYGSNSIYPAPTNGTANGSKLVYPVYMPSDSILSGDFDPSNTTFSVDQSGYTYKAKSDDLINTGTYTYSDGTVTYFTTFQEAPYSQSGVMWLPADAAAQTVTGDGAFAGASNLEISSVGATYAPATYSQGAANWLTLSSSDSGVSVDTCGYTVYPTAVGTTCTDNNGTKVLSINRDADQVFDSSGANVPYSIKDASDNLSGNHSIAIPAGVNASIEANGNIINRPTNDISGIDIASGASLKLDIAAGVTVTNTPTQTNDSLFSFPHEASPAWTMPGYDFSDPHYTYTSAPIHVPTGATLTVYGQNDSFLKAYSGSFFAAGIGGDAYGAPVGTGSGSPINEIFGNNSAGTINIQSGNVLSAAVGGAPIGGGGIGVKYASGSISGCVNYLRAGSGGNINITGSANVKAYMDGQDFGFMGPAAIGGGGVTGCTVRGGDSGNITIDTTGTVVASTRNASPDSATTTQWTLTGAAIGTGSFQGSGQAQNGYGPVVNNINIKNGTVVATTNTNICAEVAAIGMGCRGANNGTGLKGSSAMGKISISGGTVIAQNSDSGSNGYTTPTVFTLQSWNNSIGCVNGESKVYDNNWNSGTAMTYGAVTCPDVQITGGNIYASNRTNYNGTITQYYNTIGGYNGGPTYDGSTNGSGLVYPVYIPATISNAATDGVTFTTSEGAEVGYSTKAQACLGTGDCSTSTFSGTSFTGLVNNGTNVNGVMWLPVESDRIKFNFGGVDSSITAGWSNIMSKVSAAYIDVTYSAQPLTAGVNLLTNIGKIGDTGISVTDINPNWGSTTGGQHVTLSGTGMPSTSSSDYSQPNLVAQYDGIDNTGNGDSKHSYTTDTWKNLKSGTEFGDAKLTNPLWSNNGIYSRMSDENTGVTEVPRYGEIKVDNRASSAFTIEWTGVISEDWGASTTSGTTPSVHQYSLAQGMSNATGAQTGGSCNNGLDWWFGIDASGLGLDYCSTNGGNNGGPGWLTSEIPGITGIASGSIIQAVAQYDGTKLTTTLRVNDQTSTQSQTLTGGNPNYPFESDALNFVSFFNNTQVNQQTLGTMNSFRFYDSAVDSSTLAANYALDKTRFLQTPKICMVPNGTVSTSVSTICSGSSATANLATNVAVTDANTLMFDSPAQTAGLYQVYLQYGTDQTFYDTGQTYTYKTPKNSCGYSFFDLSVAVTSISTCSANSGSLVINTAGTYSIADDPTWKGATPGGGSASQIPTDHALMINAGLDVTLNIVGNTTAMPVSTNIPGIDLGLDNDDTDSANLTLNVIKNSVLSVASPTATTANTGKAGIHVPAGANLTIEGDGIVSAKSGSVNGPDANNGNVQASFAGTGAGIGGNGGQYSQSGVINITGNVTVNSESDTTPWTSSGVTYYSGCTGAAIGSGGAYDVATITGIGSSGAISITGNANVTAAAGGSGSWGQGAGIGGGGDADLVGSAGITDFTYVDDITINTTGTVIATSADSQYNAGAGIGTAGGDVGTQSASGSVTGVNQLGKISIINGLVISKGGDVIGDTSGGRVGGAGIGYGGQHRSLAAHGAVKFGEIDISGGTVIAEASVASVDLAGYSFGIGGSEWGDSVYNAPDKINITGGNIFAFSGKQAVPSDDSKVEPVYNSISPAPTNGEDNGSEPVYPVYIPKSMDNYTTNGTNFTYSGNALPYNAEAMTCLGTGTCGDTSAEPLVTSSGQAAGIMYLPATDIQKNNNWTITASGG